MPQAREYPEAPVIGIGVVVLGPQGILLIKRGKNPGKGKWSLPGGAQEIGETVFEAGRREVKEETGLDVRVGGIVDVVDSIIKDADQRIQYHYTLIDLFAVVTSSHPPEPASDAEEVRWFSLEHIEPLNLWHETTRVIQLAYELHSVIEPE